SLGSVKVNTQGCCSCRPRRIARRMKRSGSTLLSSAKPRRSRQQRERGRSPDWRSLSPGVYAERGDFSRSVRLNISGASEFFCCSRLLADLPRLIGGGIVGSMPSNRTQQQTADLFQATGVQESCRTHTSARLTSAQRSAAAVSGAEKLSLRHVLPRDLSNAPKHLDDGTLHSPFPPPPPHPH